MKLDSSHTSSLDERCVRCRERHVGASMYSCMRRFAWYPKAVPLSVVTEVEKKALWLCLTAQRQIRGCENAGYLGLEQRAELSVLMYTVYVR